MLVNIAEDNAGRPWDDSGVNPTLNQCNAGSGIIGASNQELFSQNANGLVMTEVGKGGQGEKAGGIGYADEIAPTIKASPSGGNQVPDVVCHEIASTLNAHYGDKMGLKNQHVNAGCPLYVIHGAQDPIYNTEHANALGICNNGLENVIYTMDADKSNSMKSANPNSGIHEADVAKTLDTTIPTPQKAQGGQYALAPINASLRGMPSQQFRASKRATSPASENRCGHGKLEKQNERKSACIEIPQ